MQNKMKTRKFTYKAALNNRILGIYCYRIGDYVKVVDNGYIYPRYYNAFKHFFNSDKEPYYCTTEGMEKAKGKVFKIIGIGLNVVDRLVFAMTDRLGRKILICPNGPELVKQFPLKRNEKTVIIPTIIK